MAALQPLSSLRALPRRCAVLQIGRTISTTTASSQELQQKPTPEIKPELVGTRHEERILKRHGLSPIGSRRRRVVLQEGSNIPFEQLPFQCFQEARKILAEDREEKLRQIDVQKKRIAAVKEKMDGTPESEAREKGKLVAMNKHLESLKIQADINDPVIRKRFEDGLGDMDREIYRHLAHEKWASYKRLILEQRVTQMHVVPDALPHLPITADLSIRFGGKAVAPGAFVPSQQSEHAPHLAVQVFDAGTRLVSVAIVDLDVPNVETDGFDFRCHLLACNIPLAPTRSAVALRNLPADAHTVLPWLPPHAHQGSPYHRLGIFVASQGDKTLDVAAMRETEKAFGFNVRSFLDRNGLKPITGSLFRCQWDEGTRGVMERAGIDGANVVFKRKKPEKLHWKYNVKDGKRYR